MNVILEGGCFDSLRVSVNETTSELVVPAPATEGGRETYVITDEVRGGLVVFRRLDEKAKE